jgi:PAS domain S-box-containing protein
MMIDITERKRMETALREARDELEARVQERTAELREANDRLKQQAKRLEALRDVDRAILAAESPDEIASVAARRAQDIVPCERVSVALFDWDEEQVRVLTAHQEEPVLESGTTFPIDEFTLNDRLRSGTVDDMPDFDDVPSTAITERLRAAGIQSAITVPMMVEGELIGTVNLGSTEAKAFCEAERRIGQELADHLAIALRQARLLEAVQEQRAQLEERVAARTAELREANAALTEENEERRRVENALRESQERLTRIIDSAIDAIISIDADLNIMLFNEAAEEIFQCASTEAECTTMDAFLSESFEALVRRHIEAYRDRDDDVAPEGRYLTAPDGLEAQRADGDTFPVEATLCPVQLPDADQYLLILRDLDELKQAEAEVDQLQSEKSYLQEELKSEYNFDEIVGTSAPMQTVFDAIERVADTETTVLITGETGTGKELVARALHDRSARADEVFVKVNCAALSSDLIESELFGHERGAFTGATEQREGRFELADGGTLLLDEIGELPLDTQAKLLRVLQHQEFERVGGSETIEVDTRILAATNRDLAAEVEAGQFRDDLYYRLNIFPIELPPLRNRPGDVPLLAEHFCETFAQRTGKDIEGFTSGAMAVLNDYHWPGNVRELANIVERAVILTRGERIRTEHLSISDRAGDGPSSFDTLEEAQRQHIERALKRTEGVVGGDEGAAQLLDVKRTTLLSRMDRLGIDPDEYRA